MAKYPTSPSYQPFLYPQTLYHHDLQPPPAPHRRRSLSQSLLPSREFIQNAWIAEVLTCIFSSSMFAIILLVMVSYNNKVYGDSFSVAQKDQMQRPTLFPILSLLSAIMRAAMLMPVATAINQLRWSWFKSSRRLIDIERFDDASRGILGSLRLLWIVRFGHFVAIGAALTVLALPIDAVIQSAIQIPQRLEINTTPYNMTEMMAGLVITDTTKHPIAREYRDSQTMESKDRPWATTNMINAIKFGISYGVGLEEAFSADNLVACPTGLCEFGKYQTLEVSHICVDRTAAIQTNDSPLSNRILPGTNLTLPKGSTDDYVEMMLTTESYTDDKENTLQIPGGMIVRTAIMLHENLLQSSTEPLAIECGLYWNIKTVHGHVRRDISPLMQETEIGDVGVAYTEDSPIEGVALIVSPRECVSDDHLITNSNGTCDSKVGTRAHKGLQNLLLDATDGLRGDSRIIKVDQQRGNKYSRTNHFVTNIYELTFNHTSKKAIANLNLTFSNIALAMTQMVRRPISDHRDAFERARDPLTYALGYVYQDVFYYHMQWARMVAPAAIVFGCSAFVLVTAIITKRERAWRRSNLPLLFHGLGEQDKRDSHELLSLAAMEDRAKHLQVKLESVGGKVHLQTIGQNRLLGV
ncbi:hypothetical protein BCR34DRAFT_102906 [Clohesyomyces aquaticus]|uniref:Uncharacterized protein n=1 Tax=Clohesyomyces aquaticus TaxID=1231657 RepID=A0A1Y1YSG0_9PLEO|nr:hypothetical protein BCR34DRAFT_102906 [Clohesyomyces aquaticus]